MGSTDVVCPLFIWEDEDKECGGISTLGLICECGFEAASRCSGGNNQWLLLGIRDLSRGVRARLSGKGHTQGCVADAWLSPAGTKCMERGMG